MNEAYVVALVLEPMTRSSASCVLPLIAATIAVASSGSEVPTATIVMAMTFLKWTPSDNARCRCAADGEPPSAESKSRDAEQNEQDGFCQGRTEPVSAVRCFRSPFGYVRKE